MAETEVHLHFCVVRLPYLHYCCALAECDDTNRKRPAAATEAVCNGPVFKPQLYGEWLQEYGRFDGNTEHRERGGSSKESCGNERQMASCYGRRRRLKDAANSLLRDYHEMIIKTVMVLMSGE
jgi:hypothetical protein